MHHEAPVTPMGFAVQSHVHFKVQKAVEALNIVVLFHDHLVQTVTCQCDGWLSEIYFLILDPAGAYGVRRPHLARSLSSLLSGKVLCARAKHRTATMFCPSNKFTCNCQEESLPPLYSKETQCVDMQ